MPLHAQKTQQILLCMLKKKSGLHAMPEASRMLAGVIVKAIQENYQNPEFEKQLQAENAEHKRAMVASLKDEMLEKQNALIRQAVRADPELLQHAAVKITSGFVRERLMAYDSIKDAYDAGGVVAGDINSILSKDLCADLIAPVIAMYEVEIKQLEG